MKLRLRFPLLTVFLLVLITDQGFTRLLFEHEDDPLLGQYQYVLLAISLTIALSNFRYLPRPGQWWLGLLLAALAGLALESYGGWGSWMVYPHVFSKLTVLLHLFAMYSYYCRVGLPSFRALVWLILLGLGLNLALYNRDALSLSAFLNNDRGFSVTSAYLFLVVALLCLNWFLTQGRVLYVLLFIGCLGMIVFLQHRTVWICTAISLPLNLLLLRRVPAFRLTTSRVLILVGLPVLIASLGGVAAVLDNPQVVQKLAGSIEDIQHPDKQGTGSWRMQQYDAYLPFVDERPIAGWRLEGFEVPVQFYSEETNTPIWDNFTGHHFHSFYLDRLFYFGLLGVLLVLLVPLTQVIKRLRQPATFTAEAAALLACAGNLVVYGISYDWAPYQYALLGLTLAALQQAVPVAAPIAQPAAPAAALPPEALRPAFVS